MKIKNFARRLSFIFFAKFSFRISPRSLLEFYQFLLSLRSKLIVRVLFYSQACNLYYSFYQLDDILRLALAHFSVNNTKKNRI